MSTLTRITLGHLGGVLSRVTLGHINLPHIVVQGGGGSSKRKPEIHIVRALREDNEILEIITALMTGRIL